jgi:hypothetical protein
VTRRDGRLLTFLFAAAAILFLSPFALGRTHVAGDILYSFHPWLTHAAQELQRGRLPLWNPYSTCGEPFLANPQVMVFFPPAQLFWMFGFADAWRLHVLLEEALLLTAAYLSARRSGRAGAALAATAAAWGGLTVMLWEFPGALATLPLMLLLLLFVRRGTASGWWATSAATALLFFAGYAQFAYYALVAGAFLSMRNPRQLSRTAAAVGAGLLLALPQILPTWDVVRHSLRAGVDGGLARQYLLTPVFLVKLLLPDLHDKASLPYRTAVFDGSLWPVARNWLNTFYVGVPALALAAAGLGRRTAVWAALGAAAALLAMGVEPFFSLFRYGVPGARYMTHFSNAMVLTVFVLGLLAAEGVRRWKERKKVAWAWGGFLLTGAGWVALSPGARTLLSRALLGLGSLTAGQDAMVRASAVKAAFFLAAFLAATSLARRKWALVLVLALADLWLFGRDVHPFFRADFFRAPVPWASRLAGTDARLAVDPRAMRDNERPMAGDSQEEGYQSLRRALFPNLALPYRIPHVWAYEVFADKRFAEARRTLPIDAPWGPVMDFLGARHITATRPLTPPARPAGREPNALLYENDGALPRVTWAARSRVITDDGERLSFMASGWDPRREVLLESGEPGAARGGVQELRWRETPGRLEASGRSDGGWLVYSETNDAGWEAYLNGKRAPLLRANHAFQAVALPAGEWRSVFLYRPRPAFAGLALGALLWSMAALGGLAALRKS